MNVRQPNPSDSPLARFEQVVGRGKGSVREIAALGGELASVGRTREADVCYRLVLEGLRQYARAGNVTRALMCEALLYQHFVKAVEDEAHYRRCFADWTDELMALGRRFGGGTAPAPGGDRVAFFLQVGSVLGHTEVLLKMLEARPREDPAPLIYVFEPSPARAFMERCARAGVACVQIPAKTAAGATIPVEHRFAWLRERFRADRIGACVWVSAPTLATFAYAARIAPTQIFWSLRFHPLAGPHIDGYLTYGPEHERERSFAGQPWRVCPVPLTIATKPRDHPDAARLRVRFREAFLTGTLAREEKINSRPFLEAVTAILRNNPHAGYLWTGRARHPGIQAFFEAQGVADRCHFVGWVDTALYAAAIDLFLETFPLGCGITGYQALGAGTPFLSFLDENTVYGMHFGTRATAALDASPVLCARDAADYIRLAARLAAEPELRRSVAANGKAFFEQETGKVEAYARRFFATIGEISAARRAKARAA